MKFLNWLAKYHRAIIVSCVIVSVLSAVMLFGEEKPTKIQHTTPTTTYYTTYETDYNTIIVYVTATGTKYHRKYCRYVDGKDNLNEMSQQEAENRRYEPCSVCYK